MAQGDEAFRNLLSAKDMLAGVVPEEWPPGYENPTHVTVAPRPIDASNTVLGKALKERGIEI